MFGLKNRLPKDKIKRELKVLNIEYDERTGEMSKMVVLDNILDEDCTQQGTKLSSSVILTFENIIDKEFITLEDYLTEKANELINLLEYGYYDTFDLPINSSITCNWSLHTDYQGVIAIGEYNPDAEIKYPAIITKCENDVEVKLILTCSMDGVSVSKEATIIIFGTGDAAKGNRIIEGLLENFVTTYNENFELPTTTGVTWSLANENEDEIVIENNIAIIKNVPGDNEVELKIECLVNETTVFKIIKVTLIKKYICSNNSFELNQIFGRNQSFSLTIDSAINNTLYIEVENNHEEFSIEVEKNELGTFIITFTELDLINERIKNGCDNYEFLCKIYSDTNKINFLGEETIKIKYNYVPFIVEQIEDDWIISDDNSNFSQFSISSYNNQLLFGKIESSNINLGSYMKINGSSNIIVQVNEKTPNLPYIPNTTVQYKVLVGVYSDSNYQNKLGLVEFCINYTFAPTDPID